MVLTAKRTRSYDQYGNERAGVAKATDGWLIDILCGTAPHAKRDAPRKELNPTAKKPVPMLHHSESTGRVFRIVPAEQTPEHSVK
jgi:hypothetical protein